MRQIFISYAQPDETFAVRLASDLRQGGAQIWIDVQDAEPGRNWARSIERALAASQMMIVVLSPAALETAHVMVEWQAYLEAHRPVIPVLARRCDLPGPLRTRRPVDFTGHTRYSHALHDLTTRLIEYGLRVRRADPVIWTMAEDVRDHREAEQATTSASESAGESLDDLASSGLRRMVSGLRELLLGGLGTR